jgi:hypothetical protein
MNKKLAFGVFVSALVAVFSGSGCGMINNLNDMHDKMGSMNDKMADMGKKLDQSNDQMAGMRRDTLAEMSTTNHGVTRTNETSSSLYQDLRQGNSLTIRSQRLESMERTDAPEAKISQAGMYIMAFEFQLYKDYGLDDQTMLDILKLQAAEEIFRELHRYGLGQHIIDASSNNSHLLNLSAFAVALHRINPDEELLAAKKKILKTSLLSMIEDTLARKSKIESHEIPASEVKAWETEVLRNEREAVYLLQLRTNFLGGMVLERLTGIQESGIIAKAKMLLRPFGVDLSEPNLEQVEEYAEWINEAVRVRDELNAMGYGARLDGKLMKIYSHMNLATTSFRSDSDRTARIHADAEKDLVDGINKYRN